jgi:DNA-binding transcriptional regulator YhcF (GntR family)
MSAIEARRDVVSGALRQRILAGLHLGTLAPGDRLASVRDVGGELHASARVVLAAYRALEAEGLVHLRPRSGIFVADVQGLDESLPEVASWVVETLVRGLDRSLVPAELSRQVRACLDTVPLRAVCAECNDDQIHALCGQVQEYGFGAVGIDLDAPPRSLPRAAAEADLVVTTRFHVKEAERLGEQLGQPVLTATLDPVFVNTVRALLEQGRVWWLCTDPRFAAKLPRIFPGYSFNPVVLGRDPLHAIPPEAMVYATRRAAEHLPPDWHRGRVVTVSRALSSETARALLTFQVRKNLAAARHALRCGR